MGRKIKLGDKEYEIENLSDQAKATVAYMDFTTSRLKELNNMQALLTRARNSYIDSLKNEMIAEKAGFHFGED